MNGYLRTTVLLAGLTALFVAAGWALGGRAGMVVAFLAACAANAWAWWNGDRMVLGLHGARPIGPGEAPRLEALVGDLAARAGLPVPALHVIEEDQPNAFATGRDPEHAAIALNTGLLDRMTEREVAAVVAHELGHVRHRDTLVMTVTATIAGAIGLLAQFGFLFGGRDGQGRRNPFGPLGGLLLAVVGPVAATVVQLAISRAREYEADRFAAELLGDPGAMIAALERLEAGRGALPNHAAEANPATAHLFVVDPLSGLRLDGLFRTHPATADRIAALRTLAPAAPGLGTAGAPGLWG